MNHSTKAFLSAIRDRATCQRINASPMRKVVGACEVKPLTHVEWMNIWGVNTTQS